MTCVLRTIHSFYPEVNGPANQAYHVSRGLAERGIESRLFTTDHGAPTAPPQELLDGIRVTRFRESFGFMAYRRTIGMAALRRETPDIIHAHGYRNALTAAAFRLARRRDIPFVLQPHGGLLMYAHILAPIRRLPYVVYDAATRKKHAVRADAVVVATEQERREAIAFGVPEDRLHVIPVGVSVQSGEDRLAPGENDVLQLLFVGRICPDRNVEQIINAMALLADRNARRFLLKIVGPVAVRSASHSGDPYLARLKDLVAAEKLSDHVDFCGPKYGADLAAMYRAADLFLYTSDYENFGQGMLEAAAHGCPIVATPTGVARDIVKDGQTGFLVPHRDPHALAVCVEKLLKHPSHLAELGHRIRDLVLREYRWDAILDRYCVLYERLLQSR